MPELPEVENTRRYLVQIGLPGRRFTGVNISWANTLKNPSLRELQQQLPGSRVESVQRRGKYLLMPLDTGATFIAHLGMAGRLRVHPQNQPAPPHLRHTFPLDDGRELRFLDSRKFGKLWLVADPQEALPPLGPEPLEPGFSVEDLCLGLAGHNAPIKALLLDQAMVAGIGNLYADESLFLAGIHPLRLGWDLSAAELARLRDGIVAALSSALAQYDRSRAAEWPDPPPALETWTIPRAKGASCPNCVSDMACMTVRSRTTWYCPQCQPAKASQPVSRQLSAPTNPQVGVR
ncbi:MAG: bifunctional DNA-formamidopyrimidine glycosylase/DNA-(apurinic or apyrimidinic site) lyase [Dehalococcoidia bacterium]|nr:bifunctional DNA-formamidopyrimidine glycosylase/DNA-(apurinic or apyrimidinic site) lyase [Dehalococcoidia bacterium]MSQ17204.1 bifunctional DNA-formamidopyrimidine glycosylase/DNA-(apurinic or apyrimidinic site) lyase [Dehalococcoidia bacterium]